MMRTATKQNKYGPLASLMQQGAYNSSPTVPNGLRIEVRVFN
jgi:hypothetical protein